ncbi:MAG: polymer-forming cytoskeletal protein [Saprospiraceae bacterium]|nr:polymer-forming cytoskeletal protein [Saprospiraceae bacterium]
MFGNNSTSKKEAGKTNGAPSSNTFNTLVQGTLVEGTVKSESDIRVDGTIKGKLICDAKVVIGPAGMVDGEIKCKNAVIEGKFQGNLEVFELLNIRDSAHVNGDVKTNKLIVQSGAAFNVNCSMGEIKSQPIQNTFNLKKEKDEEQPTLKAAK